MIEKNPLKIIATERLQTTINPSNTKSTREEIQARFEKMWKLDPEQFDPSRNCMERERVRRTMDLIDKHVSLEGKKAVDLGCGSGALSLELSKSCATVDAVDAASLAL